MDTTDTNLPEALNELTQIYPHEESDSQKMLDSIFGIDFGQQEPTVIFTGQRTYGRREVFIVDESELEAHSGS